MQHRKMYPVLFKIGKLSIFTYGAFVAAGFVAGILLAKREAGLLGEDQEKIMDLCFYILIAAIIGSRFLYVVINPEIFFSDPLEIFRIWNGGLVFYGGFIAAVGAAIIYLKNEKISIPKTSDIMAPSIAIGHFLGRMGCFFAGCCYGRGCDLPWAVKFTHPDSLAPIGIPLHPTQLYSSLNNLMIFTVLWCFRRRKKYDGQLFLIYVFLYGITRSFLEVFRGDDRGDSLFGIFSVSQVLGLSMAVVAVIMLLRPGTLFKKLEIEK
ncbi:prolipoprotein diacylglyceryl transferase [Thermodesulfobacteriota bacterium]